MGTTPSRCNSGLCFRASVLPYLHNDLSKNLSSNTKLFVDDTFIFTTVKNVNVFTDQLNSDLEKISNWAHQWKMSLNLDLKKQAQEIIFSRKKVKDCHPSIVFNDAVVGQSRSQKHLGIHLNKKLDFNAHIKEKISKANRGIGIIKKLQSKMHIRPHLNYGDQPTNDSFCKKLESVQYNAALAITGVITRKAL